MNLVLVVPWSIAPTKSANAASTGIPLTLHSGRCYLESDSPLCHVGLSFVSCRLWHIERLRDAYRHPRRSHSRRRLGPRARAAPAGARPATGVAHARRPCVPASGRRGLRDRARAGGVAAGVLVSCAAGGRHGSRGVDRLDHVAPPPAALA